MARRNVARFLSVSATVHSVTYDGLSLEWHRTGAGPEVIRTEFWASTNEGKESLLGSGQRFSGGWKLSDSGLPKMTSILARGYVQSDSGTCWVVQDQTQVDPFLPPQILIDSHFGLTNGFFGFNVKALIDQGIVVDASSDLQHWTARTTNLMTAPILYFLETNISGKRFYRARLQ